MTIWVCHIRSALSCSMRPVRTAWSCSLCFRSSATSWMDSSHSVGLHAVRLRYMISPLKALSLHSYRKPYSLNAMIPYCNLQYPVYFLHHSGLVSLCLVYYIYSAIAETGQMVPVTQSPKYCSSPCSIYTKFIYNIRSCGNSLSRLSTLNVTVWRGEVVFPCVCISHIPQQDDYDLTANLNMNSSNRISANIISYSLMEQKSAV